MAASNNTSRTRAAIAAAKKAATAAVDEVEKLGQEAETVLLKIVSTVKHDGQVLLAGVEHEFSVLEAKALVFVGAAKPANAAAEAAVAVQTDVKAASTASDVTETGDSKSAQAVE